MKNNLTNNYEQLKKINLVIAQAYYEKKYHCLEYSDISKYSDVPELRGKSVGEIKKLIRIAKGMLKHPDIAWSLQFSPRAKTALLENGYTSYKQLYIDVMEKNVDLEDLKKIGHQVAMEIQGWCKTHPA